MVETTRSLEFLGSLLHRPESVLACSDGNVYASDRVIGIARVSPDGAVGFAGTPPTLASKFVPNGIALCADGDFLIANIGDDGGLWRLTVDGRIIPELVNHNGHDIPPVNFAMVDRKGRIWLSVSTRRSPRHLAYRNDVADGFIALVERGRFRIVAEGLAYTNEIRLNAAEDRLYASETFGHRISQFRVAADGTLSGRKEFGRVEPGDFVDGIALDEAGGLWAICIVSNRVYRFDKRGRRETILAETPTDFVNEVIAALGRGEMGRQHFDTTPNVTLRNVASIAFCGLDLRTAVLGSICGDRLVAFDPGVRGVEPVHWHFTAAPQFLPAPNPDRTPELRG